MNFLKKNKGITLIALVVSIIVLLILAGVSISAITGNESAMEKATEAREKNEQGAELDAIKLAVVNSVASGLDGLVNADNLKEGLTGLVENEGRLSISKDNSPWQIIGNTGKTYEISQNGNIEVITGIILSTKNLTLEIKDDIYGEEIITARLVDIEGTLTWTATSNIINITPSVDGMSATIKAVSSGNTKIIVECSTGDKAECSININEIAIPKIGDYIDLGKDLVGTSAATDDWKILYNDVHNQKIYAILSDYLRNEKLPTGIKITGKNTYGVKSSGTYLDFISGLKHETAWKELISDDLIEKYPTIKVYGGLEKGNITTEETMDFIKEKRGGTYYIPIATNELSSSVGGYWLASSSMANALEYINKNGTVRNDGNAFGFDNTDYGVCPIVILPSNVQVEKDSNGIWKVII